MQKDKVNWQSSADKLFFRLSQKCSDELLQKFIDLSSSYISNNSNLEVEPSVIKLLRSIEQRIKSANKKFLEEFEKIIDLLVENIDYLFPTNSEYNEYILTPITDMQASYHLSQMSLSLSSPVAFPEKPSINIVKRYFDCDLKLKLKLKLGIFFDDWNNLFWETGFIFPDKSIQQLCKNSCTENSKMMVSSTCLKKIVDKIFEILLLKKDICGIDLTPAHYHILPFSLRLGGKIMNPDKYNEYKLKLSEAIEYTFEEKVHCSDDIFERAKSQYKLKNKLDTLTLSMLLYKKLIFMKDSKEIFSWTPPRVIILKEV